MLEGIKFLDGGSLGVTRIYERHLDPQTLDLYGPIDKRKELIARAGEGLLYNTGKLIYRLFSCVMRAALTSIGLMGCVLTLRQSPTMEKFTANQIALLGSSALHLAITPIQIIGHLAGSILGVAMPKTGSAMMQTMAKIDRLMDRFDVSIQEEDKDKNGQETLKDRIILNADTHYETTLFNQITQLEKEHPENARITEIKNKCCPIIVKKHQREDAINNLMKRYEHVPGKWIIHQWIGEQTYSLKDDEVIEKIDEMQKTGDEIKKHFESESKDVVEWMERKYLQNINPNDIKDLITSAKAKISAAKTKNQEGVS